MGLELPLAKKATVLIELPAPDVGDRYKKLTAEQFRKHAKYIVWAEYSLHRVVVDGMEILLLEFRLPKPKEKDGHHVSAKP